MRRLTVAIAPLDAFRRFNREECELAVMAGGSAANGGPRCSIDLEFDGHASRLEADGSGFSRPPKCAPSLEAGEHRLGKRNLAFQVRMHIIMKELVVEDPVRAPWP